LWTVSVTASTSDMRRVATAVFVISTLGFSAACGTSFVSAKSTSAPALIAEAHSPAEVRAAVIRALSDQRYTTEGETPGEIRARFERGNQRFRVRVAYSATEYAVHYTDSVGYDVHPQQGGDTLIESRYARLVEKLKKSVERELRKPAEAAAQREAEERQYQLMLEQARSGVAPAPAPAEPSPVPGIVGAAVGAAVPALVPAAGGGATVEQNTSVKRSDQSLTCTINGTSYACPSQAAFDRCVRLDPTECKRR
jgi:hypothetical protein